MSEQQWQPIETAPKDGTQILGFAAGDMTVVEWWWPRSMGQPELGYWSLAQAGSCAEDSEWSPTHWMPLPEPPQ